MRVTFFDLRTQPRPQARVDRERSRSARDSDFMLGTVRFIAIMASAVSAADERRPIRWGIMGTGAIASDFVKVLRSLPDTAVAAIGSRTEERAQQFADELGLDPFTTTTHSSYANLMADDSLDVVYVATPSLRHVDDSLACLQAGRPVVCEKSMAPSVAEARQVLEAAAATKLFFLHGVWSRFFPAMARLREAIRSGVIGTVISAHASFCQADGAGACSATLETGIYCAQFLLWVFEDASPTVRGVVANMHPSGHDQHVTALLDFSGGGVGTLECSLMHASPRAATICGTKGVITVPFPFWCPTRFTVQPMDGVASQHFGQEQRVDEALPEVRRSEEGSGGGGGAAAFNFVHSEGLAYEAAEVNRCLRAGLLETPAFGSEACLKVMQVIEDVRAHFPAPEGKARPTVAPA